VIEDLPARYHEYLDRFAREVGSYDVGQFAKFRGKLIKKLSFDDFTPLYIEYTEMIEHYYSSLERGDTVNDLVLHALRDQAASLIMQAP